MLSYPFDGYLYVVERLLEVARLFCDTAQGRHGQSACRHHIEGFNEIFLGFFEVSLFFVSLSNGPVFTGCVGI